MNDNKSLDFCPHCGTKCTDQMSNGICSNCGNNIYSNINQNSLYINQQNEKKVTTSGTIYLILSIVSTLIGVPIAFYFGVIWLLFGAFSGNANQYYTILYMCIGFIVFSILNLIASIINIALKGMHTLKSFLIATILTLLFTFSFYYFRHSSNGISSSNLKSVYILNNKTIYSNSEYTVKQIELKQNKDKIVLILDIDGDFDNKINMIDGRVNYCYVKGISVERLKDGNYYFEILKKSTNNYRINDLWQIDLYLPLPDKTVVSVYIREATFDNQQKLSFENDGFLYQNTYFKLYYSTAYSYNLDVYIESLVNNKYYVRFSNMDFDTPSYINSFDSSFDLSDLTISHNKISINNCEDSIRYLKGEYEIIDDNNILVDKGIIDENFGNPKLRDTCKNNE